MAACEGPNIVEETDEVCSPLPRAPPPSPECPSHNVDITQFDFNALLFSNNRPRSHGPSPVSSRGESEPASPSWNHSPFFYPSPDHPQATPSDPSSSSPSSSITIPVIPHTLLTDFVHPPNDSSSHPHLFSGSLPVNGEMQRCQILMQQQNQLYSAFQNHTPNLGNVDSSHHDLDENGERKRKISLKRHHEEAEQSWHSSSVDPSWLQHDITKKKACHEERERESRHFRRSPSPQQARSRAKTFSGVYPSSLSQNPLLSEFNHMSLAASLKQKCSQAATPQTAVSFPVAQSDPCQMTNYMDLPINYSQNCTSFGGHMTNHVTQTIGFVMENENTTTDDQMDIGDMETNHSNTTISITKADSIDYSNPMDYSYLGHQNHTHNPSSPNNTFSFNLDSISPSHHHLHPHINRSVNMGGVLNSFHEVPLTVTLSSQQQQQQQQQQQTDSCSFSRSL